MPFVLAPAADAIRLHKVRRHPASHQLDCVALQPAPKRPQQCGELLATASALSQVPVDNRVVDLQTNSTLFPAVARALNVSIAAMSSLTFMCSSEPRQNSWTILRDAYSTPPQPTMELSQ